jgi:hypothetical protein
VPVLAVKGAYAVEHGRVVARATAPCPDPARVRFERGDALRFQDAYDAAREGTFSRRRPRQELRFFTRRGVSLAVALLVLHHDRVVAGASVDRVDTAVVTPEAGSTVHSRATDEPSRVSR